MSESIGWRRRRRAILIVLLFAAVGLLQQESGAQSFNCFYEGYKLAYDQYGQPFPEGGGCASPFGGQTWFTNSWDCQNWSESNILAQGQGHCRNIVFLGACRAQCPDPNAVTWVSSGYWNHYYNGTTDGLVGPYFGNCDRSVCSPAY